MKKHLLFLVSLLCSLNFIAQTPIEFDILQGSTSSDPYDVKELNGNLYYFYDSPETLFDGYYALGYVNATGVIVKPHYELPVGYYPYDYPEDSIYEINGNVYFLLDLYDDINGNTYYGRLMELKNDTIRMVNTDIDKDIYGLIKFNNKLYFQMYGSTTGYELYSYDGTSFNLENDLLVGTESSYPYNFNIVNNMLHFTSTDWPNNKVIFYRTDGVTYQSDTLFNHRIYSLDKIYYANNEYFYLADVEGYSGTIIHKNSNDSLAIFKHGNDFVNGINSRESALLNNQIIFLTYSNSNLTGNKIYRYDVINDTNIVIEAENSNVNYVNEFVVFNNDVYVNGGISSIQGYPYLGKIDLANDTVLTQYFNNQSGPVDYLKVVGNNMFFSMQDVNYGNEAFKYVSGTAQLVVDNYNGVYGSYPYNFFSFNGNLGFTAEVNNGKELFIMCSNTSLPTAPATQIACEKSIISDLNVTGTNLSYHTASSGGAVLNENTQLLANGSIYVASNIICPSARIEVPFTISMLPNTAAAYLGDSLITVINPTTSYQWIDCANDQNINGATSQTFKAPGNGSYKCLLTNQDGCKIETNCINIINLSINENEMNNTKVYPNPSFDILHIDSDENMKSITLKSINGATIHSAAVNAMQHTIDVSALSEGIYFLEILNENNVIVSKQKIIVKK